MPDHAVHRRADFVAHVGEEFALGLRGGLGASFASRSSTVRSATSCSRFASWNFACRARFHFSVSAWRVAGLNVVERFFLRITSLSDWPSFPHLIPK